MNCIICNTCFIKENLQIDIFFTSTTHTNTLVINFIKKLLNCDLDECHSRYLCQLCFSLFEELDYAELTCTRLRKQITDRSIPNNYSIYLKDGSTQTTNDDYKLDDLSASLLDSIKSETNINKNYETDSKNEIGSFKKSKPYRCNFCQKNFTSKTGLNLHIQKQHENDKEEKRDELEQIDSSIKIECDFDLEDTFKSDPEQSDSNGNDENVTTTTKNTRLKNSKTKAISTVKPLKYSCPQCPKMWRTLGELRNHVATHSTLRPYICEICGQAYKHKSALDIHIGMHNGINPFCCQYCNKTFTQKGALQRHLPIHTGEAPFQVNNKINIYYSLFTLAVE